MDNESFALILSQRDRLLAMLADVVLLYRISGVPSDAEEIVDEARALISEITRGAK